MSNSSTTTESDLIEPIHPGEILMEDFIEGFGITQNKLAVSIGVPPRRINEIVHGKRGITADRGCCTFRGQFGQAASATSLSTMVLCSIGVKRLNRACLRRR